MSEVTWNLACLDRINELRHVHPYRNLNQDREDQAFGIGHYHHHTPSSSGAAGGTLGRERDREAAHRRRSSAGGTGGPGSPVASHGSANSSLKFRSSRLSGLDGCGNRISPPRTPRAYGQVAGGAGAELFDPNGGVDTISPGDGGLTPGSTFDASEVDRCVRRGSSGPPSSNMAGGHSSSTAGASPSSGQLMQMFTRSHEESRRFVSCLKGIDVCLWHGTHSTLKIKALLHHHH